MRKPRKAALAASMLSSCLLIGVAFTASPAAADPATAGRSFNNEITACITAAGTNTGPSFDACVEAANRRLMASITTSVPSVPAGAVAAIPEVAPVVMATETPVVSMVPAGAVDVPAVTAEVAEAIFVGTAEGSWPDVVLDDAPVVEAEPEPEAPQEEAAPSGGHAGGVWERLRWCESTNNYSINTGNGYYGAYQFSLETWWGLGYTGYPHLAHPAVQDQAAMDLQARDGWWPWPSCARMLGLL